MINKIFISILTLLFFSGCDEGKALILGCTDDTACNYNSLATQDDDEGKLNSGLLK